MTDFACPNCRASVSAEAPSCPGCGALFGGASAWKPVPRKSLGPAEKATDWGDVLMFPVKLLISTVCFVFGFAALFGGEWDWVRPVAALFFFGLGMATWFMLFPSRVRRTLSGLLMVAFGLALVYTTLLSWRESMSYPMDCSGWRRPMGCYVGNWLHAVGGTLLVRVVWALFGAASAMAGAHLILGARRHEEYDATA